MQENCNCRSTKKFAVSEVLIALLIVKLSWMLGRVDLQTFTDMPEDCIDSGVQKDYPCTS
jgi:hypothetical protein